MSLNWWANGQLIPHGYALWQQYRTIHIFVCVCMYICVYVISILTISSAMGTRRTTNGQQASLPLHGSQFWFSYQYHKVVRVFGSPTCYCFTNGSNALRQWFQSIWEIVRNRRNKSGSIKESYSEPHRSKLITDSPLSTWPSSKVHFNQPQSGITSPRDFIFAKRNML